MGFSRNGMRWFRVSNTPIDFDLAKIPKDFVVMFAGAVGETHGMDKRLLAEKGANGQKYYNEYFEKEKCLRKLDEIMRV